MTKPALRVVGAEDSKPKLVGQWDVDDDGVISYEARVYPDGCELVVVDDDEGYEIITACGLEEIDKTIEILKSVREIFAKLPKKQQGAPEPTDEEEPEEESEEEEEEEPGEAD